MFVCLKKKKKKKRLDIGTGTIQWLDYLKVIDAWFIAEGFVR
jgi:hypothetical protein